MLLFCGNYKFLVRQIESNAFLCEEKTGVPVQRKTSCSRVGGGGGGLGASSLGKILKCGPLSMYFLHSGA